MGSGDSTGARPSSTVRSMAEPTLDYARQRRSRRFQWTVALLILSACAVGYVGKLCWHAIGEPLLWRLHVARQQQDAAAIPWPGLNFPPAADAPSEKRRPEDDRGDALLQSSLGSAPQGQTLFFGEAGSDTQPRYLLLTVTRTESHPVGSVTLVARLLAPASSWKAPRLLGDTQILPLLTYRRGFTIDPVMRSPSNPSLFLLTGRSDDVPFRFELSVDGRHRVELVEDRSSK